MRKAKQAVEPWAVRKVDKWQHVAPAWIIHNQHGEEVKVAQTEADAVAGVARLKDEYREHGLHLRRTVSILWDELSHEDVRDLGLILPKYRLAMSSLDAGADKRWHNTRELILDIICRTRIDGKDVTRKWVKRRLTLL